MYNNKISLIIKIESSRRISEFAPNITEFTIISPFGTTDTFLRNPANLLKIIEEKTNRFH